MASIPVSKNTAERARLSAAKKSNNQKAF